MPKMTDEKKGELIDALLSMRTLLAEPGSWTQNTLARRRYQRADGTAVAGPTCYPTVPIAEMWCVVGAACAVTRLPATNHPVQRYLTGFLRRRYDWPGSVQQWNDDPTRTQEEVLGLIELALEELKA